MEIKAAVLGKALVGIGLVYERRQSSVFRLNSSSLLVFHVLGKAECYIAAKQVKIRP